MYKCSLVRRARLDDHMNINKVVFQVFLTSPSSTSLHLYIVRFDLSCCCCWVELLLSHGIGLADDPVQRCWHHLSQHQQRLLRVTREVDQVDVMADSIF